MKGYLKREDDFTSRREHLKDLSDVELRTYFWELIEKTVDPLIDMARTHTTPSVERSVLLRMGFSSIDAKIIVDVLNEKDLLKKGVGHCVYVLSKEKNLNLADAAELIKSGEGIEFLMEYFGYYE